MIKTNLIVLLSVLGLSPLLTQNLTAALAIAVASNGKWAIAHDQTIDSRAVSAEAIAKCKARGGADARIAETFINAANGAVAVSDNGTGKIVGFSFAKGSHHLVNVTSDPKKDQERAAINDCKKKGGQNPKVMVSW
jgi:hypothetical protein